MNGIELAARCSYIVNALRYCGPKEAKQEFLNYFNHQATETDLEPLLKKFEGLYPYLHAISKKHNKQLFDFDVVEAYWIGNELLNDFSKSELADIINHLVTRGLPRTFADQCIKEMPMGLVPHHNFNVFYMGVGRTSGKVEPTLDNMNSCRLSWGRVTSILENKLIVQSPMVNYEDNQYSLLKPQEKEILYLKEMLPNIREGDMVGIHWNMACLTLTQKQQHNLEHYTLKILNALNNTHASNPSL